MTIAEEIEKIEREQETNKAFIVATKNFLNVIAKHYRNNETMERDDYLSYLKECWETVTQYRNENFKYKKDFP